MASNVARFTLSPEEYLKKHHLLAYMEDCVSQMLATKDDKIDPTVFMTHYFTNVRDGHHVMFREYFYVHLTPHNRISFVRLIWICFRQIGRTKDLLSIHDYHSLITLLCPDFPFNLLYKTARTILLEDAHDCLISFSDFIHTFQLQLYYDEFFDKVFEIYESMQQGEASTQDTVVVPSGHDVCTVHVNVSAAQDGVSVPQFLRLLAPVCDSTDFSTIEHATLRDLLHNDPTVTFYGFLMVLSRSEIINASLGVLPKKSELYSQWSDAGCVVNKEVTSNRHQRPRHLIPVNTSKHSLRSAIHPQKANSPTSNANKTTLQETNKSKVDASPLFTVCKPTNEKAEPNVATLKKPTVARVLSSDVRLTKPRVETSARGQKQKLTQPLRTPASGGDGSRVKSAGCNYGRSKVVRSKDTTTESSDSDSEVTSSSSSN